MSKSGDALGDRSDPIKPQGIDRQAAQRGQHLDAVVLPVPVGVFPQLHIPHPMPAVLNGPALPDGSDEGLGASAQTRDVVSGLVLERVAHRSGQGLSTAALKSAQIPMAAMDPGERMGHGQAQVLPAP